MRLMACIGQVLSILPIPDIMNYLDAILVPRLQHMQQLVKQEVKLCGRELPVWLCQMQCLAESGIMLLSSCLLFA